ncbi:hypothetical protein CDD81_1873 [Ophiocordyceps australis]|uniref:Uncharacterized protein n=1 Tax=Ophiocordyceps australis TaxID=1399860 RepID=A0A2C5XY11_9HYPO|nr:hypothetical protein CDD81_1873 [Ophiocordyceps australis]
MASLGPGRSSYPSPEPLLRDESWALPDGDLQGFINHDHGLAVSPMSLVMPHPDQKLDQSISFDDDMFDLGLVHQFDSPRPRHDLVLSNDAFSASNPAVADYWKSPCPDATSETL